MSINWAKLKYFTPDEDWGDVEKMDENFVTMLDQWRGFCGFPFHLTTPAYATSGHAENSFHYKGRAADGRFIEPRTKMPLTLKQHILFAILSPFNGVGIYTWSKNGPFLHVDNRVTAGRRQIWVCEKAGQYEPLTMAFLSKAFKA